MEAITLFLVDVGNEQVRDDDLRFFTPLIAQSLGLYSALLIQYLHINLREPTYVVDDIPWLERTCEQLAEQEKTSIRTIQRVIKKLEDLDLVHSTKMRRKRWNQTKSYTLSYPHLLPLLRELYREHVEHLAALEERQKKTEQSESSINP